MYCTGSYISGDFYTFIASSLTSRKDEAVFRGGAGGLFSGEHFQLDYVNKLTRCNLQVHADISAIEINYDDDAPFVPDPRFNNFDLADLTRNLELNQPLLNSTPERFAPQAANCAMNLNEQRGNFIHTQRFNAIPFADLEIEGPMSPEVLARNTKRSTREEPHCDENGVGNMSRLLL